MLWTFLLLLLIVIALPWALEALVKLSVWVVILCIAVVCCLWIRGMF